MVSLADPHSIRERFFPHHNPSFSRLNHGSFGSCPLPVLQEQDAVRSLCLRQPDFFFRKHLEPAVLQARQAVAAEVRCTDVRNLVLVDNVTTAATMVAQLVADEFRAGRWKRGAVILVSNHAYAAVKKGLARYIVPAGGQMRTVQLPFPHPSNTAIVDSYRQAVQDARSEGRDVALVLVDHVSSMPTLVLPVAEIIREVRSQGVGWVLVDGAHAVGSIPVDLESLSADFYTGNLHKWAFAPLAVAIFHCAHQHLLAPDPETSGASPASAATVLGPSDSRGESGYPSLSGLPRLHHPIVSHGFDSGLDKECFYVGTRDYSTVLAVPAALEFARSLGGGSAETVARHNHNRVVAMAQMLAQAWETFVAVPEEMCASMAMVALPKSIKIGSQLEATELHDRLREEFFVEAPILYWPDDADRAVAYVRISHQVYNTPQDFHVLKDAISSIMRG